MNAVVIGVVILVVAVAGGAIWLRFVPPPGASTLLRIRNGAVVVSRGQVRAQARADVTEIMSGKVAKGFIAITHERRVVFSRQIPAALHQRLRNVLINQ